ncbi:MAG TPA: BatA domain-containing protein, partial [Vicinamibacterales bacterium]|nr:BatA domain-containing protein [Vicinamibacterales bacterium]
MTWGNPWAWIGLAALAVPVIIHLLTTVRATPMPFPTVRFLPPASPAATHRRRIDDWLRLVVRLTILALAVAALAQPWLAWRDRQPAERALVARAVVVDSSASMARPSTDGRAALDVARSRAADLIGGARLSTLIESDDLGAALKAARHWIDTTPGVGRGAGVFVISDFQVGAFVSSDVAVLPSETGVELIKVVVTGAPDVELPPIDVGAERLTATATFDDTGTRVRWVRTPAGSGDQTPGPDLEWLAGPDDAAAARATVAAARQVTAVGRRESAVTLVWPGTPERARLLADAGPVGEPWMAEIIGALPREAAVTAASRPTPAGSSRLYLFPDIAPGTLESG